MDDNGNGAIDCADVSCQNVSQCVGSIGSDDPSTGELCANGVDDDQDGSVDCADDECLTAVNCL